MTYIPGQSQIFTITTTDPVAKVYGFQVSARLDSDPENGQAGDFNTGAQQIVLCDDGSLKGSAGCAPTVLVQFIEHSSPFTRNIAAVVWTAPASNVGTVTIYVTAAACNGDATAAGDHVYTAKLQLHPSAVNRAAALYSITDLGVPDGYQNSYGRAVNASGQVAVVTPVRDQRGVRQDRSWRSVPGNGPLALQSLGTLGGVFSSAVAMNDFGQVAGTSTNANGTERPSRSTPNGVPVQLFDLGSLDQTESAAGGINNSGEVVVRTVQGSHSRAFRSSANGSPISLTDLGTLGGTNSQAWGINASGQVAGGSDGPGDLFGRAFRSSPSGSPVALTDLGTLGGPAVGTAINDAGQVVGDSDVTPLGIQDIRAFISTPNGVFPSLTP